MKTLHKKYVQSISMLSALIALSIAAASCERNEAAIGAEDIRQEIRAERIAHNKAIFDNATALGDPYTALVAAYSLLEDDSANKLEYLDTMASLYVEIGIAEPAIKLADRVLEEDPENIDMLELRATGKLNAGESEEGMKLSRELYEKTNKVKYLFTIAMGQMQEQKFNELKQTLNEIEKHPNLNNDSVMVMSAQPGQQQNVPASAALEYMKAILAGQRNDLQTALRHFRNAVKIYPQFDMAARYLEAMENPQMQR